VDRIIQAKNYLFYVTPWFVFKGFLLWSGRLYIDSSAFDCKRSFGNITSHLYNGKNRINWAKQLFSIRLRLITEAEWLKDWELMWARVNRLSEILIY